jgi:hypothetical protein
MPVDVLVDTLIDTLTLNASFRYKKTGKYRYIRRRRAGSGDVNEGPFDEAAWANILKVQEPTRQRVDHREVYRLRRELHYKLSLSRARDRPKTCVHIQGGFCTYWRWKPGEHLFLLTLAELDEQSRRLWGSPHESTMLAGDGKLLVRASLDYCKDHRICQRRRHRR